MATPKRIWSTNELIIAYYIAKWGYVGLNISEEDFVDYVIGNTSIPSLRMQVANFRYLLNIEGYQLKHASKLMKKIVDDLDNLTITQVRRIIKEYVKDIDEVIVISIKKDHNKKALKRRDELNAQYQSNFEAKLEMFAKSGRKLKPLNK